MDTIKRLALAGLLAALAGCSSSVTWTEYVYKDQRFAVSFTAPPKASTHPGGFLVEETTDAFDLGAVATCTLSGDKSSDAVLSDAVDAIRTQGTVRNVSYTATGDLVGRVMLVDRLGAPTIKERVFVKGKCLYQVYAADNDGPDSDLVAHFLDSFRLL